MCFLNSMSIIELVYNKHPYNIEHIPAGYFSTLSFCVNYLCFYFNFQYYLTLKYHCKSVAI